MASIVPQQGNQNDSAAKAVANVSKLNEAKA